MGVTDVTGGHARCRRKPPFFVAAVTGLIVLVVERLGSSIFRITQAAANHLTDLLASIYCYYIGASNYALDISV